MPQHYNNNPFGIAKGQNMPEQPVGIMQVATPTAPMVQDEPGIVDMAKGKAQEMAMAKGEEYLMGALNPATAATAAAPATGALTGAASAAAPAAAAGKGAGAAGGGLMAGAASMAAPVLLGGLVLSKLFK